MSGITLDDAEQAKEEAGSDRLRDNDAGIPEDDAVEWEDSEIIRDTKLHPQVLVAFDHIARISIQDYGAEENILNMEQNLEGAGLYGFDIEITVANPEIVSGQLWAEDTEEYPSHKVLGDPDADTNPYELRQSVQTDEDGTPTDVETLGVGSLPGGNSWDGQPTEYESPDYMTLTISGSRGTDVLGALDTGGRWFTDSDGTVTEGLFEVPPTFGTDDYDPDVDPAPRLTGYPELRADMVGQRGAFLCSFDTDDPSEAGTTTAIDVDVFRVDENDDMEALTPLSPDDDAYAKPTYPRVNNTFWQDGDAGSGAEPEHNGGVSEAQAIMDGDSNTSDSDTSDGTDYDDLTDDEQEFVDAAVEVIDADETPISATGDFEDPDFAGRVEEEAAQSNIETDADTLSAIIERHTA